MLIPLPFQKLEQWRVRLRPDQFDIEQVLAGLKLPRLKVPRSQPEYLAQKGYEGALLIQAGFQR
jgi:hypothetical protein